MAKINGNEAPEAITKIQLLTKTSTEGDTPLANIQLERGEPLFDPNNDEGKRLHIGTGDNDNPKISFYDAKAVNNKITALKHDITNDPSSSNEFVSEVTQTDGQINVKYTRPDAVNIKYTKDSEGTNLDSGKTVDDALDKLDITIGNLSEIKYSEVAVNSVSEALTKEKEAREYAVTALIGNGSIDKTPTIKKNAAEIDDIKEDINTINTETLPNMEATLIGTEDDTKDSNTIKGAKTYADSIELWEKSNSGNTTKLKNSDFFNLDTQSKYIKIINNSGNLPLNTGAIYLTNTTGIGTLESAMGASKNESNTYNKTLGIWKFHNFPVYDETTADKIKGEGSEASPKLYACDLVPTSEYQNIGNSNSPVNRIAANRIHSKNFDLSQTGLFLANKTSLAFNVGNGNPGEKNWFSISKGDTNYAVLACELEGTSLVIGYGITATYSGTQIFSLDPKGNISKINSITFDDSDASINTSDRINTKGRINAGSFNAYSDARLKENFQPLTPEKSILDLPTYKFDFIDGVKNQIGCKAQDLQEICPEIVTEGSDGYLSIQESKIVYLLLEEVKKLRKEINELKGV